MTVAELERELKACYGEREGHRVYQTIMPGILGDFLRMVTASRTGSMVQEAYRLEDGKGEIRLSCRKTADPPQITAEFRRPGV